MATGTGSTAAVNLFRTAARLRGDDEIRGSGWLKGAFQAGYRPGIVPGVSLTLVACLPQMRDISVPLPFFGIFVCVTGFYGNQKSSSTGRYDQCPLTGLFGEVGVKSAGGSPGAGAGADDYQKVRARVIMPNESLSSWP